jgi:hypothetical protein
MARTIDLGWDAPDGAECRIVLDACGEGEVEILEVVEEGTETLRPDLLDAATAALPGLANKIHAELDRLDTGNDYSGPDTWDEARCLR